MNTRKIALIAVLIALAVGTNYMLMPFYNVKFMDFIVFMGGFCLGPLAGGLIGASCWAVYGILNPLGFSLGIWVATIFSEAIFFGVAGGFMRKMFNKPALEGSGGSRINLGIFFGVVGVFSTLAYDIITTVAFWFILAPQSSLFVVFLFGVPFTAAHLLSNAIFFGVGSVPVINLISKLIRGGEKTVNVEK
jgi:hypothetical protein